FFRQLYFCISRLRRQSQEGAPKISQDDHLGSIRRAEVSSLEVIKSLATPSRRRQSSHHGKVRLILFALWHTKIAHRRQIGINLTNLRHLFKTSARRIVQLLRRCHTAFTISRRGASHITP